MIDGSAGRSEFINLCITSRLEGERMTDKPWISASNYVKTFTDKNSSLFMTQLTVEVFRFDLPKRYCLITRKSFIGFKNGGTPISIG
jgi:hypothetical protein